MEDETLISPVTGRKLTNLIGKRFGRLTVIKLDKETMLKLKEQNKRIRTFWLCKCDCGNSNLVSIVQESLINENGTRSCGCLQKESIESLYIEKAKNNSFAQHLIDLYGDNALNLYWSDKNTLNPWEINYGSNKTVWIKCQEKDYHEDYEIKCIDFSNGNRCPYCSCQKGKVHPRDSFAQWGIDNLGDDFLEKYWSNKNNVSPWSLPKATNTKVWMKCIEHNYHEDYPISCGNFINSRTKNPCHYCRGKKVDKRDSLGTILPQSLIYWSDKNEKSAYEYSCYSNKKVWFKCPNCEYEKEMKICDFYKNLFRCNQCGDGFSFPSKIMFSVLKQLNIEFETEYKPIWCQFKYKNEIRQGFYDFYFKLNCKEYVVETDGKWHNEDNNISGQTKEESKFIDDEKDRLAMEHNIEKPIRINCDLSSLEFIKQNILKSRLNELFNLSNIDWLKCLEYALSSRVKEACDLWNSSIHSTIQIGKIMSLSYKTIREYLEKGIQLNWCDYKNRLIVTKENKEKALELWNSGIRDLNIIKNELDIGTIKSVRRYLNELSKEGLCNYNNTMVVKDKDYIHVCNKEIIIIESLQKFNSLTDLSNKSEELFGIKFSINGISNVCSGRRKTIHGYHIMYYSEYLKQQSLNKAI